MGLYTWVPYICSCGKEVQFQTKSDPDREYGSYDIERVPAVVARELDGETEHCMCGRVYTLRACKDLYHVKMEVVEE